MIKIKLRFPFIAFLMVLLFASGQLNAEIPISKTLKDHIVKGHVRNSSGEPLRGVSVILDGTKNGTMTNSSGEYSLSEVPDNATLVCSSVGFTTEKVPVEGRSLVDVVLHENNTGLNDVVVVGYGTQKKIDLTGAVDVVAGTELQNRSAPTVSLLMQGLSPNLDIEMSNRGGEPGSYVSWTLRGLGSLNGNATPLILVDGVESGIDNLDPENIQSISVLKDAAASAIYGSRAPFGVVLITTKRGQKNKGIKIQYNDNFAWASPIRYPLDANSITWASAANAAYANSALSPAYSDEQIQRIKGYIAGTYLPQYDTSNLPSSLFQPRSLGNANYDWTNMLFRKNSLSQKHNVSVSGGDDKTQYYVSAGFFDQGGLYNWGNDSYKRYNILANLDSKPTKWLSFHFGTNFSQEITNYPLGTVGEPRAYNFTSFFQYGPMTPLYNTDGTLNNPIVTTMKYSGRDITYNNDLWIRLGTEIEPIKGWKTDITYNYDIGYSPETQDQLPIPVELPNGKFGNSGFATANAVQNYSDWNYYILDALTSYEKTIGHHYFKAMLGYEEELSNSSGLNASAANLISVDVPSINAATGATTLSASAAHWATQAIFGRLNYNFNEKYLIEFSGRYNGSSRFAPDSRWGFFPSVSAGYNISKEDFWSSIKPYVNDLKLRASYGSLGNQNVANYLYLLTVPVTSNLNYIIDNARPVYAANPGIVSNSLTWETVTTTNLGLDATFLKNRLGVTFDWYDRKTTNMFGPAESLPAVLGTTVPLENNASLGTKGWELSLNWNGEITSKISYFIKLNLGDNKTTILKYNNATKSIDNWYDGESYGDMWGLVSDGLIQQEGEKMADQTYYYPTWGPGDMKYKDLNNDGVINEGERTLTSHGDLKVIGNSQPRYNVGFSLGINWKGFSISTFWQGILKRDYLPSMSSSAFYGYSQYGFKQFEFYRNGTMLNYWRPSDDTTIFGPNTNAYFPKPYATSEEEKNIQPQSRFVLNAAYVRLKNLQIGYNIPHALLKNVFIENLRIYVTGENLITITKLPKSLDPETVFESDVNYGGLEGAGFIYPVAKRYSVGINLTF